VAQLEGIRLKKKHGQHFLRERWVIDAMLDNVTLDNKTSVFEIGCGDGFLTGAILSTPIERLFVFEIDEEWATHVQKKFANDKRLRMNTHNFLDVDLSMLDEHQPWTLLANLPYNVTFPILHRFVEKQDALKEGVIMVQEEVAQKITKTRGRNYGFISLYFQYHFEWKLLDKISPETFYPAPKVFSRLLYFKPRNSKPVIKNQKEFWEFIKLCFKQPRRMLLNNLKQSHYDLGSINEKFLKFRAQELIFENFIEIYNNL
jgi:16S rRNA (adenine1518-N6/adenine1519-N6)-dimethyltransferase